MSLPIKPICNVKDARRNGTSLVYLQYCFSAEKRTLLNTKISIPFVHWNETKSCIKNTLPANLGDFQALNDELIRMRRLAEDLVHYAARNHIDDPGVFVKQAFKPDLDLSTLPSSLEQNVKEGVSMKFTKKDFFQQLDDYIQFKKNKVSKSTTTVFETSSTT